MVRAKTGTGKTLAFLIAALESAISRRNGERFDGDSIPILIISPTRELATQIATEAVRLLKSHRYKVQSLVGGYSRRLSDMIIDEKRVDVLVATPGRINDRLESNPTLKKRLKNLECIIFDEADQLLDMGFKDEIESIQSYLPKEKQTFLFSATMSDPIKKIAKNLLRKDYVTIDTVGKDDVPTHLTVKQSYMISPLSQSFYTLWSAIKEHQANVPDSKIIVFFPTYKMVQYAHQIFSSLPSLDILQIYSLMTQSQRSQVSDTFRKSTGVVLFTTDISARGVDYPNVTLVIQMGMPTSREQYIHRIGRTGRAGKSGEAFILLSPYEKRFLYDLNDLPLKEELRFKPEMITNDEALKTVFDKSRGKANEMMGFKTFLGFLGYYRQFVQQMGLSKQGFADMMTELGMKFMNLTRLPALAPDYAQQMGLLGTTMKIQDREQRSFNNNNNFEERKHTRSFENKGWDRNHSHSHENSRVNSSYEFGERKSFGNNREYGNNRNYGNRNFSDRKKSNYKRSDSDQEF